MSKPRKYLIGAIAVLAALIAIGLLFYLSIGQD
jgi:hypothetical protein